MRLQHRSYHSRRAQYDRIRHALDGQDAMRDNAALYLRRPTGLTTDEWSNFVKGAHFYPVAETTLRTCLGLAFRKPINVKVPPRLEPMLSSASFDGRSVQVLAEDILREVLSIGRCCALLDFPAEGNSPLTTPYISFFAAEDIRDWRMDTINGRKQLTMLRLHEFNEELEDTGTEQHLVLTLEPALTVRRFHIKAHRAPSGQQMTEVVQIGDDIIPVVGGAPITYIPAVIFGPYNLSPDTEKPPMLDLVDVNIAHFENSANLEHSLWMSAMPTPVVTGNLNAEQKPSAIGPSTIWFLPEGATAFYLAAPSDAHASLRQALIDKENRMNALGATMILSGQRRNEAAETASMRHLNDNAVLLSSINQVEAGLRTLLTWAADWVQPGEVLVEFNRDLVASAIDPQLVQALLKAVTAGAMSKASFVEALRKGEVVSRTTEEELDQIEEEGGDMSDFVPRLGGIAAE